MQALAGAEGRRSGGDGDGQSNPPAAAATATATGTWTQRALLLPLLLFLLLAVACSVSTVEARCTQVAGPAGSGDPGPQAAAEAPHRVAISAPHKGMGALAAAAAAAAALQKQQEQQRQDAERASGADAASPTGSSATGPSGGLGWDWEWAWASRSFETVSGALRELASRPLVPAPAGPKHDLEGAIPFEREQGRVRSPGASPLPPARATGSASAPKSASASSNPHSRSSSKGSSGGGERSARTSPIPVHRSSRVAGEPAAAAAFVDNAPPSLMPSARLVAPLTSLEDGAHWVRGACQSGSSLRGGGLWPMLRPRPGNRSSRRTLKMENVSHPVLCALHFPRCVQAATMQLGGDTASSLPTGSSLPVRLVVDTGMPDTVLFNKSACVPKYSMNPDALCANNVRSPSFDMSTCAKPSRGTGGLGGLGGAGGREWHACVLR